MKKFIFTVATVLIGASAFAQDDKVYGPEAEDWALSIDATPFLNYFGNFIGGTDANAAPTWSFLTTNQQITGKYFMSSDMAFRGSVRLGFGSNSETNMVLDRTVDPADYPDYPELPSMVENKMKMRSSNIGLSGGVEFRKGEGRLQGYYGGELGISFSSSSTIYEYGNELTLPGADNPVGVSGADDFSDPSDPSSVSNIGADDGFGNDFRVLENKSGATIGFGLRGFIGAEYFILPKFSLGGEFGLGLFVASSGSSFTSVESVGNVGGDNVIGTVETEGASETSFGFDADNNNTVFGPAGSIKLTFHF